jgi:hypothetical protein
MLVYKVGEVRTEECKKKKKKPRRWKTGQKWRMGKNLGGDRVVNGNGNLLEWHLGTGIWEDGK